MLGKKNLVKLAELRSQFETAAAETGSAFPASCAGELAVLADVTLALGGDDGQVEQVLGEAAYGYWTQM